MSVVYSEDRISPNAQAKMAELQLTLAMARAFVESRAHAPDSSEFFRNTAVGVLARIDKALDGSIHSFTPNGARR